MISADDRWLFRAQDNRTGKPIVGYLSVFFHQNGTDFDSFIRTDENTPKVPVRTGTVRQCTGLKDKNGQLIFEGDTVIGKDILGFSIQGNVTWGLYEYSACMEFNCSRTGWHIRDSKGWCDPLDADTANYTEVINSDG